MQESPRISQVLVVSDLDIWVRSLDSTLGPHGFALRAVPTAEAALQEALSLPPDLIIICSTLRDRTSLEVCATLRNSPLIGADVPVVVITPGPCNRETRLESLRVGAWECYGFPPDPEVLLLKLQVYAQARHNPERPRPRALEDLTRTR
jgi:CheY-like chemotaxis protein